MEQKIRADVLFKIENIIKSCKTISQYYYAQEWYEKLNLYHFIEEKYGFWKKLFSNEDDVRYYKDLEIDTWKRYFNEILNRQYFQIINSISE